MRKTINMLMRNSLKNAFIAWPVVLGLTLLIGLLSIVLSLMTAINARVVDNYKELNRVSNLRDAVINLGLTEFVGPSDDNQKPENTIEAQQYYIYNLEKQYALSVDENKYDFYWSRTDSRNLSGILNNGQELKIKTVAKFTPDVSEYKVDQLAIAEGRNIKDKRETVIDKTFAKKNGIKIGDIIRVQADDKGAGQYAGKELLVKSWRNFGATKAEAEKNEDYQRLQDMKDITDPNDVYNKLFSTYNWLQVVGFGESADLTMPIMDQQTPLPNKSTELVAYVHTSQFGLFKDGTENSTPTKLKDLGLWQYVDNHSPIQPPNGTDIDAYYSIKLKNHKYAPTKSDIEKINRDFVTMIGRAKSDDKDVPKVIFANGDKDYQFANRVTALQKTISVYEGISGGIVIAITIVVLFTVALVTRKQIEKTRSQIGVMKALGYAKRTIIFNYIALPFISSLLGGIIGFIGAQFIQTPIINLFNTYFNLDLTAWSFDWLGFFISVILMWFLISAVSFLMALRIMNANTLDLLNAAKSSHISKFGMKIKNLDKKGGINSKMVTALLASNTGKMASVTAIVLVATTLMTAAFMTPTMLNDNKKLSFEGIKYKQIVEYNNPTWNDPYTFVKTWDPTVTDTKYDYKYSSDLQKITALPLISETVKDEQGNDKTIYHGYDMNDILNQLSTGKISSEYYDMEFHATPDETGQPGTPSPLDAMTANMKMLNAYSVSISNKYLKTITDWAMRDEFGYPILANQWPDYLNMTLKLRDISDSNVSEHEKLIESFDTLQTFYKKYTESVGLVITRDFWDYNTNAEHAKHYNSNETDDDYKYQLTEFNKGTHKQAAYDSYKEEKAGSLTAFGDLLKSITPDKIRVEDFKLSTGDGSIPMNHIMGNYNGPDTKQDAYLTTVSDSFKDDNEENNTKLKNYISDYLAWYGAYFSQRSGSAIVQAAFSRPPYFVAQYAKRAYYSKPEERRLYRFSFGTTAYNPDIEQLGTKLDVETLNKIGKDNLQFKIYGLKDKKSAHKYLDLTDANGTDLINKLLNEKNIDNWKDEQDVASIIINKSLEKKLGISTGDRVDLNVLYSEMTHGASADSAKDSTYNFGTWKSDGTHVTDDSTWDQSQVRPVQSEKGFVTTNDMDTFSTKAGAVNFTAGNSNLGNDPSAFYQNYLDGKVKINDDKKPITFKVIGVEDSYGNPTAWIKNNTAEQILKYDKTKEYLFNTLFRQQFADTFVNGVNPSTPSNDPNYYYLGLDLRKIDYKTFMTEYVNGTPSHKNDNGSQSIAQEQINAAKNINRIFENAYPVFNFKFSNGTDTGDMESTMPTWTRTGGYSPLEMNGGRDEKGRTYNGIGTAAYNFIFPVQKSKDILNDMTGIIMAVIIIIITLVVCLTFVIIMLTTSLIIGDNSRFISTMKVLGYKTNQIVNTVLGMYAVAIVVSYVVGFLIGWFSLKAGISSMSIGTTFVIPLLFRWWLIFAVALAICGIYIITFAIGFARVKRTDPLVALKDEEN